MKEQIEEILGELCVDHGFCLSPPFWEAISTTKHYKADEFVKDIFIADHTGAKDQEIYEPIIKAKFISKFGKEVHCWNNRLLLKRGYRVLKKKERKIILLDYARKERLIKNKRYKGLEALFKGRIYIKKAKHQI